MGEAQNDSSLACGQNKEQEGGYSESTKSEKKKVHFATLRDICHLNHAGLEPQIQKYEGRVVLRSDSVKDDSGAQCVLLTRARLRLKWRQQNRWTSLQDFLIVMDKQLTPYLLTPKAKWRTLQG